MLPTFLFVGICLAAGVQAQTWDDMRDITPRGYVAHRASAPVVIDGRLDDPAWLAAPWTDPFVDIEGDKKPLPTYLTRARLLWDDDYLYVGVQMEEPHVWGDLTERNAVIFYDNDIEVFIDPNADNHGYYEFEMNALNTIWELTLEKPYKDGGPAISPTNLPGLKSAAYVDGTVNASHDIDKGWSVEIAFPLSELAAYNDGEYPKDGDQWRMGFSRVQWQHQITAGGDYEKVPDTRENNWVWSPQGIIDMHRPERWGFVQFTSDSPGTVSFQSDPTLPARDLLMDVYHAQKAYHQEHERWAGSLDELAIPASRLQIGDARIVGFATDGDRFRVTAEVRQPDGSVRTLYTNHLSRIWEAP